MHLKLLGERCLFRSLVDAGEVTVTPTWTPMLIWEVTGGVPLGSDHNTQALKDLLKRDSVDDLVLFPVDESSGDPIDTPLDPSLTCYELKLVDGAAVYASANPYSIFENPAQAFWVPLTAAPLRYAEAGKALSIAGQNRRRVVKTGPDGWEGSVARTNTCLDSDGGLYRWSFRVGTVSDAETEERLGDTMYNARGMSVFVNDSMGSSPSRNQSQLGENSGAAEDSKPDDDEDGNGRASGDIDLLVKEKMRGSCRQFPNVVIGVADEEVPLDGTKVFADYPQCYMLDVASGAFYSGADKRPTYVDGHVYQIHHGMVITFSIDTDRGALNIVVNGKNVLVAPVNKAFAQSLYPVVEIYTQDCYVDIM